MWLPLMRPLMGAWPATQVCVLTGNPTGNPLICRPALNPLSHTSLFPPLCLPTRCQLVYPIVLQGFWGGGQRMSSEADQLVSLCHLILCLRLACHSRWEVLGWSVTPVSPCSSPGNQPCPSPGSQPSWPFLLFRLFSGRICSEEAEKIRCWWLLLLGVLWGVLVTERLKRKRGYAESLGCSFGWGGICCGPVEMSWRGNRKPRLLIAVSVSSQHGQTTNCTFKSPQFSEGTGCHSGGLAQWLWSKHMFRIGV